MTDISQITNPNILNMTENVVEEEDPEIIKARREHKKYLVLKSRKKHIEKYNADMLTYYHKMKLNEDWKKKRNEQCKINMRKYNEKKKLAKLANINL